MLIYEVNLNVDAVIFEAFMDWLKPHIKELLSFEGFIKALLCMDDEPQDDRMKLVVHYYLASEEHYQHYIKHHASRMRQDGLDRFGNQFTASRRLLNVMNSYSS